MPVLLLKLSEEILEELLKRVCLFGNFLAQLYLQKFC